MSDVVLSAISRADTGKKISKQLRREGKIPAVYYAHSEKSVSLILDEKEMMEVVSNSTGLINLSIDKKKAKKCIVKEIQFDPIKNRPIHVDMMGVRLKEKVTMSVPVVLRGEPIGVKEQGAVLAQAVYDLEVSCLPLDIPENIEIDVAELRLGDSIHVKDLSLDKIEILNDPEVVLASVTTVRGPEIEEEVVVEGEELEEAEEETEETEE